MKLTKWAQASRTIGLIALAGAVSPAALAGIPGWYGGFNVGQSTSHINDARVSDQFLGAGITTNSIERNDQELGYKVYGGYQFGRLLALEGGYFALGEFNSTATTTPPGTFSTEVKFKGVNIDILPIIPITESFSAFGRVGLNYAEARGLLSGTGAVVVPQAKAKQRDTNYKFGVGLEYDFTKHLGVRAEMERYRVDDISGNRESIDLASLGLIYRFGIKPPPPVVIVAAPQPVAPPPPAVVAPPPPPPPPPVLPQPVVTKTSFAADSFFEFNQSYVKPTGKLALDEFVANLRGTSFDVITVTGHTDRIGTHAYNMALSARRADAVKNYLVESAGIPPERITAVGTNGSNPITKPGDCPNSMPRKELHACLQPDRRVEVEVTASKVELKP